MPLYLWEWGCINNTKPKTKLNLVPMPILFITAGGGLKFSNSDLSLNCPSSFWMYTIEWNNYCLHIFVLAKHFIQEIFLNVIVFTRRCFLFLSKIITTKIVASFQLVGSLWIHTFFNIVRKWGMPLTNRSGKRVPETYPIIGLHGSENGLYSDYQWVNCLRMVYTLTTNELIVWEWSVLWLPMS